MGTKFAHRAPERAKKPYAPSARCMRGRKGSSLFVADVLFLCRIKEQIADGRNQTVDTKGDHGQKDVRAGSGSIALGLERGVVDDQTADPTQEKGEQKTNEIVVIHFVPPTVKYKSTIQPAPTEKARILTVYHHYTYFRLNVNTLKQIEI